MLKTILKVAVGAAVLLLGYGVYKTYTTKDTSHAPTRADALAAFEKRKATAKIPPGATPAQVTEAQKQAWADGWLASAAKGNGRDDPRKCDENIDAIKNKPSDKDLVMAWSDGYFSYCGIHMDE